MPEQLPQREKNEGIKVQGKGVSDSFSEITQTLIFILTNYLKKCDLEGTLLSKVKQRVSCFSEGCPSVRVSWESS
jgi:hypothetical protein